PSPGPLPSRAGEPPPLLPLLGLRPGVELELERCKLSLQLAVARPALGIEASVDERLLDGAAGLRLVGAVGETAAGGQLGHVVEGLLHSYRRLRELQLPHAGRVEEEAAARHAAQLSPRRRVPAAAVLPDLGGRRAL